MLAENSCNPECEEKEESWLAWGSGCVRASLPRREEEWQSVGTERSMHRNPKVHWGQGSGTRPGLHTEEGAQGKPAQEHGEERPG